jgi:L-ascorbate metabolism protein UlaG (beta-lactamase superfamily)
MRSRRILLLAAAIAASACGKNDPSPPASTTPAPPVSAATARASATASAAPSAPASAAPRAADVLATSRCEARITPLYHATMMIQCGDIVIYTDPVKDARYDGLPKATLVLITDIHFDHLDPAGLERVRTPETKVVVPRAVADKLPPQTPNLVVLANGASETVGGFRVEAVPMYNLKRGPKPGALFHDKGRGNGYVLTIGDKRLYFSGDTECIPEMKALKDIDVAFVCMNLPYTMPPAEAAECIDAFRPKVVYPYHYRESDLGELGKALTAKDVEVRVREWYPK